MHATSQGLGVDTSAGTASQDALVKHILDRVTYHAVYDDSIIDALRYARANGFADGIGMKLITLHIGAPTSFPTDATPRLSMPAKQTACYRQTLGDNLDRLIDLGAGRFVLCVENYRIAPLIFEVIQPYLDSGALSLCWDLAKTYDADMQIRQDLASYLWDDLAYVRQVHLHDIRSGASHRVIGSGSLDFMAFLPRLAGTNVLEYCIEVRPRESAAESLANLEQLIEASIV